MAKRKGKKWSNAKKIVIDGIKFDSKLEGQKYKHLKQLQDKGIISNLTLQHTFELLVKQQKQPGDHITSIGKTKIIRPITYKADFVYLRTEDNQLVIMDVKGRAMEVYKLKIKLLRACYPSYNIIEVYQENFEMY